jgi:hypothetical protein
MGFLSVAWMRAPTASRLHGTCQPIRGSDHSPTAAGISALWMLMAGARSCRGERQAAPTGHALCVLHVLHVRRNIHPSPAFYQTYMGSALTISRPCTGWQLVGYPCVAYAAGGSDTSRTTASGGGGSLLQLPA